MLLLLIILLVLALGGGYYGHGAGWGYAGWSPLGLILVIFVVLLLLGRL